MVYDLEDVNMWESVLFHVPSKKQLMRFTNERMKKKKMAIIEDEEVVVVEEEEMERATAFQMLRSWVSALSISQKDLETRWPGGRKLTCYRKAQLETFAPYLMPDGLITHLTTYNDLQRSDVVMVTEWFKHRCDCLEQREINKTSSVTTERFSPGQSFHLKSLRFVTLSTDMDMERHMDFYCKSRVDGLLQRTESPGKMTETFQDREDFLYYRHAVFSRRVQVVEPEESLDPDYRPLEKVVERFHRNRSKPASEDVAERVFLLAEREIELTYHIEDDAIIPARRNFIKPTESTETQKAQDFNPDMVSTYERWILSKSL
ncbi:hypothetical protein LDENG_00215900 [Lucifuga dentata]|nr:hypothetical protein LDENG_00215900 [Lucifuga dentata]